MDPIKPNLNADIWVRNVVDKKKLASLCIVRDFVELFSAQDFWGIWKIRCYRHEEFSKFTKISRIFNILCTKRH